MNFALEKVPVLVTLRYLLTVPVTDTRSDAGSLPLATAVKDTRSDQLEPFGLSSILKVGVPLEIETICKTAASPAELLAESSLSEVELELECVIAPGVNKTPHSRAVPFPRH